MKFVIGTLFFRMGVALSLLTGVDLLAATLYEEPHGPIEPPPTIGILVGGGQTVGIRFYLDQPAHITAVDTIIGDSPGSFYAALVPLSAVTGFPSGSPLLDSEVIHSAVFNTTWEIAPIVIPFDVTVGSGAYGLLLGSDLFGARAYIEGAGAVYESVLGSTGIDYTDNAGPPWQGWHELSGATIGVTIEGTLIPEPLASHLAALGALVFCMIRWKWLANILGGNTSLAHLRAGSSGIKRAGGRKLYHQHPRPGATT